MANKFVPWIDEVEPGTVLLYISNASYYTCEVIERYVGKGSFNFALMPLGYYPYN